MYCSIGDFTHAFHFYPERKTLYKMMVANIATYENIDLTAETIEDAFDHVIDKLIELGGDNNAEN